MANVNSTTSASSNGLSGLVSGVNTDEMVEKMLTGTQAKINKAKQEQQLIEWKQEKYIDIIDSINGFANKYIDTSFDSPLNNNLGSSDYWNSKNSTIDSDFAKYASIVSTSTDATVGDMSLQITQLAAASSVKGSSLTTRTNVIEGTNFDITAFQDKQTLDLTFDLNGVQKTLTIAPKIETVVGDEGKRSQVITLDAIKEALATSVAKAYGGSVTRDKDGKITGTKDGYVDIELKDVIVGEGEDRRAFIGLSLKTFDETNNLTVYGADWNKLGVTAGSSTYKGLNSTLAQIFSGQVDVNETYSFSINDTEFSFKGSDTLASIINTVNSSDAGAVMQYSALTGALSLSSSELGSKFTLKIEDNNNVLANLMGVADSKINPITSDQDAYHAYNWSSKVNDAQGQSIAGSSLGSAVLASDILAKAVGVDANKTYSFSIAGKEFSFTGQSKIEDVVKSVNDANLGVEMSFNIGNGSLSMKTNAADGTMPALVDKGNFLAGLFGKAKAADIKDKTSSASETGFDWTAGGNIKDATVANVIGSALTDVDTDTTIGKIFGIAEDEQAGKTYKFSINGKEISVDGNTSINDFVNAVNAKTVVKDDQDAEVSGVKLAFNDGVFSLKGLTQADKIEITDSRNVLSNLFKMSDAQKAYADGETISGVAVFDWAGSGAIKAGEDAEATIDGVKITRNSNTFSVNGVTLNLKKVTDAEGFTISTARDVNGITETVKNFVNDYNELVDRLYKETRSEATYKDYKPLTDAQRKEMSESEISAWEKKAQTGILRGNDDIEAYLNEMRAVFYSKIAGSDISLYDIGIEETDSYKDYGKLTFNESKFKESLNTYGDKVTKLFTDSEDSFSKRFTNVINRYVGMSYSNPGVMVTEAYNKTTSKGPSNLSTQKSDLAMKITDLLDKFEKERQKYWNMFNAMEQTLNKYNTQLNNFLGAVGY